MKKLIMTIGMSGSGKTTWAEQYAKENENVINVNRDDTRVALFLDGDLSRYNEYEFNHENEKLVTSVCFDKIKIGLSAGKTVIVSDTNLNKKVRRRLSRIAVDYLAPLEVKVFEVDLQTCLDRQYKRTVQIPEYVIRDQFQRMCDQGWYQDDQEQYMHLRTRGAE